QAARGVEFERLFAARWSQFLDETGRAGTTALVLQSGLALYASAARGARSHALRADTARVPVPAEATEAPLERLDTGDAQLRKALDGARKALNHDIPILIEGETGTGKELLAKAIH